MVKQPYRQQLAVATLTLQGDLKTVMSLNREMFTEPQYLVPPPDRGPLPAMFPSRLCGGSLVDVCVLV